MLHTLHEVLIFLEDKGRVSLPEFKGWKNRQVRGALGRLEREKWVTKDRYEGLIFYELSPQGQEVINGILSYLRTQDTSWDGVWRLVMFDVPEKERDLRDKFRRGLMGLNLRNLQGSVWVSSKDVRQQVQHLATQVGVSGERLNIFTARAENDQNVANSWDLAALHKEYSKFAKKVDTFLTKKSAPDSYETKKTIFEYALLRRQDPDLPKELLPADWAGDQAHDSYLRLRKAIT